MLAAAWVAYRGLAAATMTYDWHWNRVWRYLGTFSHDGFSAGPMLKGLWLTIYITFLGLVCSMAFGICGAFLRLSPWPVCAFTSRLYVVIWRATPLLLQLFIAYFLLSPVLGFSPLYTAITALAFFEGAYFAEIFRAGILSIHKYQWEAALSLGFSLRQTFQLVILPQATRNMLPTLSGQAISLLKDSTLVSAIAVADLTMQSQAMVAESFLAFEVWLLAGAIYLFLALCISLPALIWEKYKKRTISC